MAATNLKVRFVPTDLPPAATVIPGVITTKAFSRFILGLFVWIIVGICFIYGVRLWFNSTIPAAFLPVVGAAFCSAISFTLVLSLAYVTGPIRLKLGGTEFEGASGPIILWCLCFFVISFGLYMLGLSDAVKLNTPADPRSLLQLFRPGVGA